MLWFPKAAEIESLLLLFKTGFGSDCLLLSQPADRISSLFQFCLWIHPLPICITALTERYVIDSMAPTILAGFAQEVLEYLLAKGSE